MSASLSAAVKDPRETARQLVPAKVTPAQSIAAWNAGTFAHEQICGLVRQVFSVRAVPPVRQVVFSAVGNEIDVGDICRRVGQSLAHERLGDVALVGESVGGQIQGYIGRLKQVAFQRAVNLWSLPGAEHSAHDADPAFLYTYLAAIRTEFDFSIVAGPAAAQSAAAIEMAGFADGIVLVLSARHSRRATALQLKQALQQAQVRLLGIVLSDREFPIPEKLYKFL
ncbi:MAG TPA: hypothetical protein VFA67_00525 [Candidatus Sulfotelmatobacter sp.]|nr:hypothetical protein [Candidatus Sulfotelmatobacter sp.]